MIITSDKEIFKTGIFGGTFDPIHNGHILLAKHALKTCDLDKVILMPSDDPYYKSKKMVSSFSSRYEMAKLAIEGINGLEVSDFELVNDTDGYTVNTLTIYKEMHPDEELYFIVGGDSLFTMENWKDADKIFKMAHILTSKRKDENKGASGSVKVSDNMVSEDISDISDELDRQIEYLKNKFSADICNIRSPQYNASSSEIRQRVKSGLDISGMTPDPVIEYIYDKGLYI